MWRSAESILAISLRWRSRVRSSMPQSVSEEARSLRWLAQRAFLQLAERIGRGRKDQLLPLLKQAAEIIQLRLVHVFFVFAGDVIPPDRRALTRTSISSARPLAINNPFA
jgi:hypothetical protein